MSAPRIAKVGLYTFEKMWDNGFRQITTGAKPIESAKDMDGLKIRVPVSPLSISMFKALGAVADQPAVQRGLFVAADPHRRRAGKSAADHPGRQALRGAEVLRRSATTSGTASGSSPTAAPGKRLPADLKTIVANAINDAGLKQRDDIKTFNETVQADLQAKGLTFTKPAPDSFRAKLRDAGFYGEWKEPLRRRGLGPARRRRRQAGLSAA